MTTEAGGLPAALRRERMASFIGERQFVRVADLSEAFRISDVTVRSDLDVLHEARAVRRVRGGAVARPQASDVPHHPALAPDAPEKQEIGNVAAALVESGASVLIGPGSTAVAVARSLARADLRDVVVVTNGLLVALELERAWPRVSVVVTGGTLHPARHVLVEPMATAVLGHIHADLAIVGCGGIDARRGVTYADLAEAGVAQRMIEAAARVAVVADASKVGQVHLRRVAPVSRIATLITSSGADARALEEFRAAGVDVVVVGPTTPARPGGRTHD